MTLTFDTLRIQSTLEFPGFNFPLEHWNMQLKLNGSLQSPHSSLAVMGTSYGKNTLSWLLNFPLYHLLPWQLQTSNEPWAVTQETEVWSPILPQILNVIFGNSDWLLFIQIHKVNYASKFQLTAVRNRLLKISLDWRLLHPDLGSLAQERRGSIC